MRRRPARSPTWSPGTSRCSGRGRHTAACRPPSPRPPLQAVSSSSSAASSSKAAIPIDFAALQQQNPDVYAWITIPGTTVNYPVLQNPTDNGYYLFHNLDGSSGYPGCVYSELCDAKDFSDFNTVLYAHNMDDGLTGTMFSSLLNYLNEDFLKANRTVIIYTPTEKRVYKIFASVLYSDVYIPNAYSDKVVSDRQAFLDSFKNAYSGTVVLDDVPVTTDSHILTLSTCIIGQPSVRYLIEAVYIGEKEQ